MDNLNKTEIENYNYHSFNVSWGGSAELNPSNISTFGTNPPNPKFENYSTNNKPMLPNTTKNGLNPVGIIQSRREPYAYEVYFTPYGNFSSKLGTNLGA